MQCGYVELKTVLALPSPGLLFFLNLHLKPTTEIPRHVYVCSLGTLESHSGKRRQLFTDVETGETA